MKTFVSFLFSLALLGPSAGAQCLSLADLLALNTAPLDAAPDQLTALLPGWSARGPVAPGDAEIYWVLPAPNSNGVNDSLATGWLSRRPNQDVLYKATSGGCLAGLRRELARAHYPVRLVNTLGGGEGVRFEAPNFSVTLYIRPKGPFQYAAVLRQNVTAPGEEAERPNGPASASRRVLSPAGVPRIQPRY